MLNENKNNTEVDQTAEAPEVYNLTAPTFHASPTVEAPGPARGKHENITPGMDTLTNVFINEKNLPVVPSKQSKSAAESIDSTQLLDGYLENGYFIGIDEKRRYPDPALVSTAAQGLAHALLDGGMKAADFNRLVKLLKKSNKRMLPVEAKIGALAELVPQALLMQQKHKAPSFLADILIANQHAVLTDKDFSVCFNHLQTIGIYMSLYEPPKQTVTEGGEA